MNVMTSILSGSQAAIPCLHRVLGMPRVRNGLCWAIVALALMGGIQSVDADESSNNLIKEKILETVLQESIDNADLFGATFAVESGNSTLSIKAHAGTMDSSTSFPLASITKLFTGAVIYKLSDQGLLNLDDKANKYLDPALLKGADVIDGIDYSKEITIRQLLSHTSGLADYWTEIGADGKSFESIRIEYDSTYSIKDIMARVRTLKPRFRPGEPGKAYYSDANYQLLGKVIENVTYGPLDVAYQKYVINPLKLKHTYLCREGSCVNFAPFYYKGNPVLRPDCIASEWSTGGVISDVNDLMTFLKAYFRGALFSKKYLEENTVWNPIQFVPLQYGMNLMKIGNMIGHSGSTGTVAFYIPETDLFIVGATGQLDTQKAMMLTMRIVRSLGE